MGKYILAALAGLCLTYLAASFVYFDFWWVVKATPDGRFGWMTVSAAFVGISLMATALGSDRHAP